MTWRSYVTAYYLKLGFEPGGEDLSHMAGIWALRLGFEPHGWDSGLKAGIWASRLGIGPQGWDLGLEAESRGGGTKEKEKEEKKEEKFALCESIGQTDKNN